MKYGRSSGGETPCQRPRPTTWDERLHSRGSCAHNASPEHIRVRSPSPSCWMRRALRPSAHPISQVKERDRALHAKARIVDEQYATPRDRHECSDSSVAICLNYLQSDSINHMPATNRYRTLSSRITANVTHTGESPTGTLSSQTATHSTTTGLGATEDGRFADPDPIQPVRCIPQRYPQRTQNPGADSQASSHTECNVVYTGRAYQPRQV